MNVTLTTSILVEVLAPEALPPARAVAAPPPPWEAPPRVPAPPLPPQQERAIPPSRGPPNGADKSDDHVLTKFFLIGRRPLHL